MNKGMLAPDDLVITGLDGRHIAGKRKVSSELAMHLLIYRSREDVNAVCTASAYRDRICGWRRALDQALLPEIIVGLSQIPLVRYPLPGTPELSARSNFRAQTRRMLLANHGAVTCGRICSRLSTR